MQVDLALYRNSASENARIGDLMALLPPGTSALDIGARDGFISKLLADRFADVTALDLRQPQINHPRIQCVQGDITALSFPDDSFDLVFCAEVLEHIPPHLLVTACRELARVAGQYVLIGVPYRQDIRVGRTTCGRCHRVSPPWGHLNTFDQPRLRELFPGLTVAKRTFVGQTNEHTNSLSSALMDLAGNPYGSYAQDEPCGHCGAVLTPPPPRRLWQKVASKAAFVGIGLQRRFVKPHPNWIHLLLKK
ncbi:MAG: class I SAM-dependent methyltransferase [Rhodoferax sp.]|nr:class I SAM-dependent methyltransferase [Rhodoferax sp.]